MTKGTVMFSFIEELSSCPRRTRNDRSRKPQRKPRTKSRTPPRQNRSHWQRQAQGEGSTKIVVKEKEESKNGSSSSSSSYSDFSSSTGSSGHSDGSSGDATKSESKKKKPKKDDDDTTSAKDTSKDTNGIYTRIGSLLSRTDECGVVLHMKRASAITKTVHQYKRLVEMLVVPDFIWFVKC